MALHLLFPDKHPEYHHKEGFDEEVEARVIAEGHTLAAGVDREKYQTESEVKRALNTLQQNLRTEEAKLEQILGTMSMGE